MDIQLYSTHTLSGLASSALCSLSPAQQSLLASLHKAELHAHLNGSIPLDALKELARRRLERRSETSDNEDNDERIDDGLKKLSSDLQLENVHDFFLLFPAIYALTSSPEPLAFATQAVLHSFLGPPTTHEGETMRSSTYLELRTTPRSAPSFAGTRLEYLQAVLAVVEMYPESSCSLIVSVDRRMSEEDVRECVDIAIQLKAEGRRVVGIDLCGEPLAGDLNVFRKYFQKAKDSGLGVTVHVAELEKSTEDDTLELLSFNPDRLGHATFLSTRAQYIVLDKKIPIEICLSSNLLCKTVNLLEEHHIRFYLKHGHPVVICTDDALPFRTSLLAEYALLLAQPPLGLGLTEEEIRRVADMGMACRFGSRTLPCR